MKQLSSEANSSYGMERTLGAFQLVMLGIGSIIGAGIFVFIGTAAGQHAGPATTLSFIIAGIACICTAFCYAELASAIPISGGSYTFAYAALGELPAFLIGGIILMAYCLSASSVACGWSGYVQSFLLDYGIQIPAIFSKSFGQIITLDDGTTVTSLCDLPALFITFLICTLIYWGTELSAIVNAVIVVVKMSVLLVFIIIGVTKIDPANWFPFIPENTGKFGEFGISGVWTAAGVILLAYTGFDVVAAAAQETKNPQRNLPIGIIGSLLICIIFYIAVSAVLTGIVPYEELNVAQPIAIAADKMGIPWLVNFIKIGAIIGLTAVILGLLYASVRILFSITHDGLLPKKLAKIHKKHHTPYIATIAIGITMMFFSSFVPIDKLVKLANLGLIFSLVFVCIIAFYLRYKRPNLKREFMCPLMPFVPLAGIVLFLSIIFSMPGEIFLMGLIWIGILLLIYSSYSQHNSIHK
jgi:APA family basic amino acid/polyamine antiporter